MPVEIDINRKIEPEFLGQLGERPLAESAPEATPGDLFPGSSTFLKGRHRDRRRGQWFAVRQLIDRLLSPDEHVLYVAHAMQVPTIFQAMSLGYMSYYYHQVLLVITDRRVFEILLNMRATAPETRIRSYPWKHVRDLRVRWGRMVISPAHGKKQAWKLKLKGDRQMVKLLLPRLNEQLLKEGSPTAVALPSWHCPECGAESATRPARCLSCSALFRSPKLAAWLSLAFPGAGLLYAGHPILAGLDFLGELLLFGVFAAALTAASNLAEILAFMAIGGFFLVMTKFESLHIGHILVTRTRPESPERYSSFRRFAIAGGVISALALTGAVLAAGSLQEIVDRDLNLPGSDLAWHGSRDPSEWEFFSDDDSTRSQWTHESGIILTLFAYPIDNVEDEAQFRQDFTASMSAAGRVIVVDDQLPANFDGFRHLLETTNDAGEPIVSLNYFVYDSQRRDIHQLFTAVPAHMQDRAVRVLEEFLSRSVWIDATP